MMRASCCGDALHELRALEQVGEAVGLEDHRHDVRLVGLVELDQPVGERRARLGQPRAQPREPHALARAARPACARARRAWRRGRPRSAAWRACRRRDVALQRVDPAACSPRSSSSARARGPSCCSICAALGLDPARERRRRPTSTGSEQPERERHRRHRDEEAQTAHAAGHARRRPRRAPRNAPAYGACKANRARTADCVTAPPDARTAAPRRTRDPAVPKRSLKPVATTARMQVQCQDPPPSARTPGSRSG